MTAPMDFRMEGLEAQRDYLEQVRMNILAAIRTGMYEGMEGLANLVVERLNAVTVRRTGELSDFIQRSPRVFSKEDEYIGGTVTARSAKYRNLGLWIEFGTKFPSKGRKLAFYPKQFLHGSTRASIGVHGHGAFRIEPKPFFNPTFQEYYPTILETINQRIAEACEAGA
jgi:hypothetical protein